MVCSARTNAVERPQPPSAIATIITDDILIMRRDGRPNVLGTSITGRMDRTQCAIRSLENGRLELPHEAVAGSLQG